MHLINIIKKFLIGATLLHNVTGRPLEIGDSIGAPDFDNSTIEARADHQFWAIWSSEQIATAGGGPADPGHDYLETGFHIFNSLGKVIYKSSDPANHAPCLAGKQCQSFKLTTGCFKGFSFQFVCHSDYVLDPLLCGVKDFSGRTLATGKGHSKTTFAGIVLDSKYACSAAFAVPADVICGPNQPMTVLDEHAITNSGCNL